MTAKTTIIPIASGKGGAGKTFLTANLAIALAEMGYPTIAVDLDLGGSNLYSFLGLNNRFPGIGDFLKARIAELPELLVPAGTPNLKFLAGDGRTPFLSNIPYGQKIRLMSHIIKLPARYILLDLGAGASFNTLDFFRLSPHGFVIITPEYPSVMNMLSFLKNFILRVIEGNFSKNQRIRELLQFHYNQSMTEKQISIESLTSEIAAVDDEAGEKVMQLCRRYRPRVIFNKGEHPDDMKIAKHINTSLNNLLSLKADYFGFIFEDSCVRASVRKRIPLLPSYRQSLAAQSIGKIARRIVKFWDRHIENSDQLIYNQALSEYKGEKNLNS